MKNNITKGIILALATSVTLTSCNSLVKMAAKYGTVKYEVTPNPLEMHGDSIKIAVSGKYIPKWFWKKATLNVQPVLKTSTGEIIKLKPRMLVGEKVIGAPKDAQVINSKAGGSFSYQDKVGYRPDLQNCTFEVQLTGSYKAISKEFPQLKIGDGTTVTPLLLMKDEKTIMAKDELPQDQPLSYSADIHYLINDSKLRPTEIKMDDIQGLVKFFDDAATETMEGKKVVSTKQNYVIKGVSISAAASPDGELDRNNNLANERGATAKKFVMEQLKKSNIEGVDQNFNVSSIGEDWDGFKNLMQASTVPDKDMILRILSTYSDNAIREREMKNISKAYTEIADQIFPKLRKAVISVNAIAPRKTDAEIQQIANSKPDSLNVEELMYAASLVTDMNAKMTIYQNVAKFFPNDWRGHNNVGSIYMMQNKVTDALASFEKADKAKANNNVVKNNLGAAYRVTGDKDMAEKMYKEAMGAGPEVSYNMANVYVIKGEYQLAIGNYGSSQSFNAALARVLNKDNDGAMKTLDASKEAGTAMGAYLKAIIAARMNNQTMVTENLAKAISMDPSLKEKAKADKEFIKFKLD